jgi:cell division inhibitor SepF
MAKIVDKVLNFMGFEEEDEETKREREREREQPVTTTREEPRSQWNNKKREREKAPIFNIHSQKQVRVIVVEPNSFDEAQGVADNLKNRCPVIVNLEHADAELAKRVVDFVSGACYALNGSLQKVGTGIFLFVPNNMDINSELRFDTSIKEKEQGRTIFPWTANK